MSTRSPSSLPSLVENDETSLSGSEMSPTVPGRKNAGFGMRKSQSVGDFQDTTSNGMVDADTYLELKAQGLHHIYTPSRPSGSSPWSSAVDASTGDTYYWHADRWPETQWEKPKGFDADMSPTVPRRKKAGFGMRKSQSMGNFHDTISSPMVGADTYLELMTLGELTDTPKATSSSDATHHQLVRMVRDEHVRAESDIERATLQFIRTLFPKDPKNRLKPGEALDLTVKFGDRTSYFQVKNMGSCFEYQYEGYIDHEETVPQSELTSLVELYMESNVFCPFNKRGSGDNGLQMLRRHARHVRHQIINFYLDEFYGVDINQLTSDELRDALRKLERIDVQTERVVLGFHHGEDEDPDTDTAAYAIINFPQGPGNFGITGDEAEWITGCEDLAEMKCYIQEKPWTKAPSKLRQAGTVRQVCGVSGRYYQ